MRKKYSLAFKHQVIKEALKEQSFSKTARKYGLSALTIYRWAREYKQGSPSEILQEK